MDSSPSASTNATTNTTGLRTSASADLSSQGSSSTNPLTSSSSWSSGNNADVLVRKTVFTGTLRPVTNTSKKKRKGASEDGAGFQNYLLTHVTNGASVDVAISYVVLTSVSGESTTISAGGQTVTSLPGTSVPTLCIEQQAADTSPQTHRSKTLSRLAPWRKPKPQRTCFEAESSEDLEMWFCWIRYLLQPQNEYLPVTVSSESASTSNPYRGPALMTLREDTIIGIIHPSTMNMVEVIRFNVITAFGNEDDDTTLWLNVCPTCRAGPAFADVSSESTRFACKYAFQPASEDIHRALYGRLRKACSEVCGKVWEIPQQQGRHASLLETAGALASPSAVEASRCLSQPVNGSGGGVTHAILCRHSVLCKNSAWKLPLSQDLLHDMVAPVLCSNWREVARRAGYSASTVDSWADQFDTMLVIPPPGQPATITSSQEAIVFLLEWRHTTDNDMLHQLVRLLKALELVYQLNLLLWALYNERVQTRPDSPMDLESRCAAHSISLSTVMDDDDDDDDDGNDTNNSGNESDDEASRHMHSPPSRLAADIDIPDHIPRDMLQFIHFGAAAAAAAGGGGARATNPSALLEPNRASVAPTPTIDSLDSADDHVPHVSSAHAAVATATIHLQGDAPAPPVPSRQALASAADDHSSNSDAEHRESISSLEENPLAFGHDIVNSPMHAQRGSPMTPEHPWRGTPVAMPYCHHSHSQQSPVQETRNGGKLEHDSYAPGTSWLTFGAGRSASPNSFLAPAPEKGLASSSLQLHNVPGEVSGRAWSQSPTKTVASKTDITTFASAERGGGKSCQDGSDDGELQSSVYDDDDVNTGETHRPLTGNSISCESRATWMANRPLAAPAQAAPSPPPPRQASRSSPPPPPTHGGSPLGSPHVQAGTGGNGMMALNMSQCSHPRPIPAAGGAPPLHATQPRTSAGTPALPSTQQSVGSLQIYNNIDGFSPVQYTPPPTSASLSHERRTPEVFEVGFVDVEIDTSSNATATAAPAPPPRAPAGVPSAHGNGERQRERRRHSTGASGAYVLPSQLMRFRSFQNSTAAVVSAANASVRNNPGGFQPAHHHHQHQHQQPAYLELTCTPGDGRSSERVPSRPDSTPSFYIDQREWSVIEAEADSCSKSSSFVTIPTSFVNVHTSQEFENAYRQGEVAAWTTSLEPDDGHSPSSRPDPSSLSLSLDTPGAVQRHNPIPGQAATATMTAAPAGAATAKSLSSPPTCAVPPPPLPPLPPTTGSGGYNRSHSSGSCSSMVDSPIYLSSSAGHVAVASSTGPTLDRVPSKQIRLGMIHRLAQHIVSRHGDDWVLLAYELGLTFAEVESLEASYGRMVERIYRLMQSWLDENGSEAASKRTLVGILRDLKWQDSADLLADLLARQCSSHYLSTPVVDIPSPAQKPALESTAGVVMGADPDNHVFHTGSID